MELAIRRRQHSSGPLVNKKKQALFEANKILDYLISFSQDIFPIVIIDEMEIESARLERENSTQETIDESTQETINVIEKLCHSKTPVDARALFHTVSNVIRLNILLRSQYFEKILRELGNSEIELPNDHSEMLRYGLIDLWDERQTLGPRFRNN